VDLLPFPIALPTPKSDIAATIAVANFAKRFQVSGQSTRTLNPVLNWSTRTLKRLTETGALLASTPEEPRFLGAD
jgi:hypothetical protein